jgi:hypothetical protein
MSALIESTKPINRGLFIPIMNATTPAEMLKMADSLESTAKALRQAASMLQQFATSTTSPAGLPQLIQPSPTVKEAAMIALHDAGKPMHVSEILQSVRRQGAQVKDQANLSSMLSKDNGEIFQIVPGMRGFWQLAPMTVGKIEKTIKGLVEGAL